MPTTFCVFRHDGSFSEYLTRSCHCLSRYQRPEQVTQTRMHMSRKSRGSSVHNQNRIFGRDFQSILSWHLWGLKDFRTYVADESALHPQRLSSGQEHPLRNGLEDIEMRLAIE